MKGEERFLTNLLEGSKTRFTIPVYQRNYDWKVEQCRQLFDDLEEVATENRESHFFGSIVCKADSENRIVIDGQQRITTSYLLLLALVKQLRAGIICSTDNAMVDMLNEEYLIDKWHKEEQKLKLKLVKDDQAAFEALYNGNEDKFISDSNVTQNYFYFCDRIETTSLTADELKNAIEKLIVIDIRLAKDDDAQRIFESLNSTGLDLAEGDKIRNFILMGLEPQEQELYYKDYWNEIEKNTEYDVSSFIRDWLAAVRRRTPAIRSVYSIFKEHVKKKSTSTIEQLSELRRYSIHYRTIIQASSGNVKVDAILRRLTLFNATVTRPFLLNLFEYRQMQFIDDIEVTECLRAVESYLFRRWVCSVPTNALGKIFETLHGDILRGVDTQGTYSEVLKRILLSKGGSGRFPRDDEFIQAFRVRNFYNIQNYKFYLYDRLENGESRERVNVAENLQNGTFSIEHIMPQTLSKDWILVLGDNHEAIQEKWLNSMANLTLTGYNSNYSNRKFAEKRDMENGFKDSGFRLNSFVNKQDVWGEAQLAQREQILEEQFLELWPFVTSNFEWPVTEQEERTLSDDFDFSGRQITAFTFMGTTYPTDSWADMIFRVLKIIFQIDPLALQKYVPKDAEFPGRYFQHNDEEKFMRIGNGLHFCPNSSTRTKIAILLTIFEKAGIEDSELSFILLGDE